MQNSPMREPMRLVRVYHWWSHCLQSSVLTELTGLVASNIANRRLRDASSILSLPGTPTRFTSHSPTDERSPETQLKGEEVYSSPGNRLRTVSRIFLASCTLFATAAISLGERPEISSSRARRTAVMMEAAMTSVGA
jgi:hypothetical protein